MAMSGATGQVFQPLGGLQQRQNAMGMNTMAVLNNISRPVLIGLGATLLVYTVYRYIKR
jgi:hypothetical protein